MTSELLDQPMPHDLECERALLGALMVLGDKRAVLDVDVEDFYLGEIAWHGLVFMAMRSRCRKRGYRVSDVFKELLSYKAASKQRGITNPGYELAVVIRSGDVRLIEAYKSRLKLFRQARDIIDASLKRIQEAHDSVQLAEL